MKNCEKRVMRINELLRIKLIKLIIIISGWYFWGEEGGFGKGGMNFAS